MRLKVDLTSGDFEEPNGNIETAFITGITVEDFEKILRSAFQNGEKTIEFSNGSLPRDCIKRWKEVGDDDAIFKARDLYFEIQLLIDLYPGLEDQLKALEDHYGVGYGFEELKKSGTAERMKWNEDHKSL